MSKSTALAHPRPAGPDDDHHRKLRLDRLLTQAEQKPSLVLTDRRCLRPYFCEKFFESAVVMPLREP